MSILVLGGVVWPAIHVNELRVKLQLEPEKGFSSVENIADIEMARFPMHGDGV